MSRFAAITESVEGDQPCGPNPDGDPDFENFLASAEGQLPASFFSFSRASLDAPALLTQISDLLRKSRDLRLLVLAAKFSVLSGNIQEFSDAIAALAQLLQERWEEVYPRGSD